VYFNIKKNVFKFYFDSNINIFSAMLGSSLVICMYKQSLKYINYTVTQHFVYSIYIRLNQSVHYFKVCLYTNTYCKQRVKLNTINSKNS